MVKKLKPEKYTFLGIKWLENLNDIMILAGYYIFTEDP